CIATIAVTVSPVPAARTGPTTVCEYTTGSLSTITPGGTWSSSELGVANVGSSSGSVYAVEIGTAVITYSLGYGGCISTTNFLVNELPADITGSALVCPGTTTTLHEDLVGGAWNSSNTSIATVGSTGIVSGVVAGSATITY